MSLVTAICLTHPSRYGLAQRAIINFLDQKYEPRLLVLVTNNPGYAAALQAFLRDPRLAELTGVNYRDNNIVLLEESFQTPSEGLLRALAKSPGDFFVAWDDDNQSHPDRLKMQLQQTRETKQPTLLMDSLYYYYDSDELFVTHYAQPGGSPDQRCAVGSLMWPRMSLPPVDIKNQAPWTVAMLDKLHATRNYELVTGEPYLFLVGSNGDNHRGADLHRKLGQRLPSTWRRDRLEPYATKLEEAFTGYRFPNTTVQVSGKDTMAYEVTPVREWPFWLQTTEPPEDFHLCIPNREWQQRVNAEKKERQAQSRREREEQRRKDQEQQQQTDG